MSKQTHVEYAYYIQYGNWYPESIALSLLKLDTKMGGNRGQAGQAHEPNDLRINRVAVVRLSQRNPKLQRCNVNDPPGTRPPHHISGWLTHVECIFACYHKTTVQNMCAKKQKKQLVIYILIVACEWPREPQLMVWSIFIERWICVSDCVMMIIAVQL